MANTFLQISPSSGTGEKITLQAGQKLVFNTSALKARGNRGISTTLELDADSFGFGSFTLYFTKGLLTGYNEPGTWELIDGKLAAKCISGEYAIYTYANSYVLKFKNGFLVESTADKTTSETYTDIRATGLAATYDLQWSHGLLTKAEL